MYVALHNCDAKLQASKANSTMATTAIATVPQFDVT